MRKNVYVRAELTLHQRSQYNELKTRHNSGKNDITIRRTRIPKIGKKTLNQ